MGKILSDDNRDPHRYNPGPRGTCPSNERGWRIRSDLYQGYELDKAGVRIEQLEARETALEEDVRLLKHNENALGEHLSRSRAHETALEAEKSRLDAGWHEANGRVLEVGLERTQLKDKVEELNGLNSEYRQNLMNTMRSYGESQDKVKKLETELKIEKAELNNENGMRVHVEDEAKLWRDHVAVLESALSLAMPDWKQHDDLNARVMRSVDAHQILLSRVAELEAEKQLLLRAADGDLLELQCLKDAGVDNWGGWEQAQAELSELLMSQKPNQSGEGGSDGT